MEALLGENVHLLPFPLAQICMNSLHILDINPLLDISFADILFHSVSCFFILSMVSFAGQMLFSQ